MIASQDWYPLNPDPLDPIECDRVTGAVVELGRVRAFVCGHALRIFERAASVHVGRDPGSPERMAVDAYLEAHVGRAALNHAVGVDAVNSMVGEPASAANCRAEEGALAAVTQTSR